MQKLFDTVNLFYELIHQTNYIISGLNAQKRTGENVTLTLKLKCKNNKHVEFILYDDFKAVSLLEHDIIEKSDLMKFYEILDDMDVILKELDRVFTDTGLPAEVMEVLEFLPFDELDYSTGLHFIDYKVFDFSVQNQKTVNFYWPWNTFNRLEYEDGNIYFCDGNNQSVYDRFTGLE